MFGKLVDLKAYDRDGFCGWCFGSSVPSLLLQSLHTRSESCVCMLSFKSDCSAFASTSSPQLPESKALNVPISLHPYPHLLYGEELWVIT